MFIHFLFSLSIAIRKEIRDLTAQEWDEYKDAVYKLRSDGTIDSIAKFHNDLEKYAHNADRFLPWHRMLLLYFEGHLQRVSKNKKLTVPYWNWAIDSEEPSKSFIFSEKYWGLKKCFEVNFPNTHCVLRNKKSMDPFYSRAQFKNLLRKNIDYSEFREVLETIPHALVHMNVGGEKGDMATLYSCTDPIFWHHHSFIDYLWSLKKNLSNEYSGSKNEILKPFGKKVKEVLNLKDCKIKYKKYQPIRIRSLNSKAGRLSKDFIKHHGYDLKRVRKFEALLNDEEEKSLASRIISFFLCT